MKEAERKAVTVRLDADPNAVVTPQPPAEPAAGPQHPPAPASAPASGRETRYAIGGDSGTTQNAAPNRTGAYIAWAVGGVALAVGAGFGAVAMKGKADLEGKCSNNVCPEGDDTLANAKTAGNISTAAFIVGGVGVALGTVLFFTAGSSSSASTGGSRAAGASAPPKKGLAALEPRAFIGIGQVGLGGSF